MKSCTRRHHAVRLIVRARFSGVDTSAREAVTAVARAAMAAPLARRQATRCQKHVAWEVAVVVVMVVVVVGV